jgi:MOSC domain-containing protein YiiM
LKIASINIAFPDLVSLDGGPRKSRSGIFKTPTVKPVFLDFLGFQGDGAGDTKIHGGKDKAVCGYCVDHFPYWIDKLNRPITAGSFGENLSLVDMPESVVNIGDIFSIGLAQIQVAQPRQPCHKLNKIFSDPSMACSVQKTGFSGYYFRVLNPGWIDTQLSIQRIHKGSFSIEKANALLRKGGKNIADIEELLALEALSDDWRILFLKHLGKLKKTTQ